MSLDLEKAELAYRIQSRILNETRAELKAVKEEFDALDRIACEQMKDDGEEISALTAKLEQKKRFYKTSG